MVYVIPRVYHTNHDVILVNFSTSSRVFNGQVSGRNHVVHVDFIKKKKENI